MGAVLFRTAEPATAHVATPPDTGGAATACLMLPVARLESSATHNEVAFSNTKVQGEPMVTRTWVPPSITTGAEGRPTPRANTAFHPASATESVPYSCPP